MEKCTENRLAAIAHKLFQSNIRDKNHKNTELFSENLRFYELIPCNTKYTRFGYSNWIDLHTKLPNWLYFTYITNQRRKRSRFTEVTVVEWMRNVELMKNTVEHKAFEELNGWRGECWLVHASILRSTVIGPRLQPRVKEKYSSLMPAVIGLTQRYAALWGEFS